MLSGSSRQQRCSPLSLAALLAFIALAAFGAGRISERYIRSGRLGWQLLASPCLNAAQRMPDAAHSHAAANGEMQALDGAVAESHVGTPDAEQHEASELLHVPSEDADYHHQQQQQQQSPPPLPPPADSLTADPSDIVDAPAEPATQQAVTPEQPGKPKQEPLPAQQWQRRNKRTAPKLPTLDVVGGRRHMLPSFAAKHLRMLQNSRVGSGSITSDNESLHFL